MFERAAAYAAKQVFDMKGKWCLPAAAGLAAAAAVYIRYENERPEVTSVRIASGKIPPAFSGYRIVQVSDLHNAEFGPENEILLGLIRQEKPDLIAVTGDLFDSRRTKPERAFDFVKCAARIAPVYFVTGNHESRLNQYPYFAYRLERAGARILENETVWLERGGSRVCLAGLKDPTFFYAPDDTRRHRRYADRYLKEMYAAVGPEDYKILLAHRPELFPDYAGCGTDLVLAGHVHGGQFRIPGLGGLYAPNQGLHPKFDAGLYRWQDCRMVLSRGLGNSSFPVRIHNRPELVTIVLEHAADPAAPAGAE